MPPQDALPERTGNHDEHFEDYFIEDESPGAVRQIPRSIEYLRAERFI